MKEIITDKEQKISKGVKIFDDFVQDINAEILDNSLIDLDIIVDYYFNVWPLLNPEIKREKNSQMHLL